MIRLEPGARLGRYEIIGLIGTGGMGRVYRARDTELRRDVALKVLPPEVATDPERRERFEREARIAGSLNHPNIVAVYDVGAQDGIFYIVTELVEGEPLRARTDKGAVSARDATDLAAQIAEALSAAHAAGIVHRDLKPENVMIKTDGKVKLLDFGLSRHFELPRAVSSTITAIATRPGMIVGTVAYMSPEQVKGAAANPQSDIFSFGTILYEMLSGSQPFSGETSVETLTAIIKQEPRPLPESVPPRLTRIVGRCLEKNPDQRFQTARDLAFLLRSLATASTVDLPARIESVTVPAKPRRFQGALPWILCGVFAAAFLAELVAPRTPDLASLTFRPVASAEEPELDGAWSPDRRSIAYITNLGFTGQVFVKSFSSPAAVQLTSIPQGPGAGAPFWSHDGNRIYFLWQGALWSVARAGGDPTPVFPTSGESPPIRAVALAPDGKTLAAWRSTQVGQEIRNSVWLSSPLGTPFKKYEPVPFEVPGSFGPVHLAWAPDGTKLMVTFARTEGPQAWILPFPDHDDPPYRVLQPLLTDVVPSFSWFPDSRHIALAMVDAVDTKGRLWVADTQSETAYPLTAGDNRKYYPAVSSDGTRILYTSGPVDYDLLKVPLDGSAPRPLLASRRFEAWGSWSPVSPEFAYATDVGGEEEVRIHNTITRREYAAVSLRNFPGLAITGFQTPAYSPDGMRLAFAARTSSQLSSIWIVPVTGGVPARLGSEEVFAQAPTWSPDGKWVAHTELRDGRMTLVKTPVGSNQPGVIIAPRNCEEAPSWSPGGNWILCAASDGPAIVSADGKQERKLGSQYVQLAAWTRNESGMYVGRIEGSGVKLGVLDWQSGKFRSILDWPVEYTVTSPIPGMNTASVAPDGKSLALTTVRADTDLWLMEGVNLRTGIFDWLPWRRARLASGQN